jgi:hypothetical protein
MRATLRALLLLAAAFGPLMAGVVLRNRRQVVLSVVLTPVLLGIVAAQDPRPARALRVLVAALLAFELAFGFVMYYLWLRFPWG